MLEFSRLGSIACRGRSDRLANVQIKCPRCPIARVVDGATHILISLVLMDESLMVKLEFSKEGALLEVTKEFLRRPQSNWEFVGSRALGPQQWADK